MSEVDRLSIDDLAQRCAAETESFKGRRDSDARFCFELLRRALAENISEAFTRIYQIYERQVLGWVYSHSRFEQTAESADFFVTAAWSTFYFALRGPKFGGFSSLPQALAYLRLCVHTAIAQYLRDQRLAAPLDETYDVVATSDLDTRIDVANIWKQICRLLPDEHDQLLARCALVEDLKPRQIVKAYPTHWRDEREVSVELYRIRQLLRNKLELWRLLGLDGPPDL